jgi:hypothetical protein
MWADFLSHFQEEADSAALYEAEVGEENPPSANDDKKEGEESK